MFRVAFPDTVKWLSLEFDPICGTAQPEDCLQLYVPSSGLTNGTAQPQNIPGLRVVEPDDVDAVPVPYWPVLHKFSSWSVLLLKVVFRLINIGIIGLVQQYAMAAVFGHPAWKRSALQSGDGV